MTSKQQGFTLSELLLTVTIAAILLGVALPSFNNLIAESKLTSTTNALIGALNLARSEAIEAGAQVTVEPVGGGGFQLRNLTTNAVLRTFDPPGDGVTITASGAGVTYQANGYRAFGSPEFTLEVCNNKNNGREITVATGGGVTVVEKSC
ncbi:prepilin-type N-terminal cleavage/methylation domain-containing protein [Aliikangiella marina]|uniref:Type II secretion system protein H n=1 Tax=Aliikangiella marina TaxID=1712262 RepID=A0A545THX5_9GAMM|nr:GspH/FimT family pseudopilin [Aliikangiella marina]TQV76829.1 prepilin-type N-terminal cleavage/methylation domain-containing protein [Aliikangiella marina]